MGQKDLSVFSARVDTTSSPTIAFCSLQVNSYRWPEDGKKWLTCCYLHVEEVKSVLEVLRMVVGGNCRKRRKSIAMERSDVVATSIIRGKGKVVAIVRGVGGAIGGVKRLL